MKTLQKTLPLRDPRLTYHAPVMTVETVRGHLGMDEDEVAEAVDDGKLTAWDIGSEGAERRELRISTESVARFCAGTPGTLSNAEAIALVIPGDAPAISGRTLARALVCSGTLIIEHIRAGDLAILPGTKIFRGKAGTPLITRASAGAFLRGRIEGGYDE
jgi:hypothetical protein